MDQSSLRDIVMRQVLVELARTGDLRIPVNASNRHVHLSQAHVEALFGPGHRLTKLRDLMQPGQYACQEQVVMETDAGQLKLRVVGPARQDTQIELSVAEAIKLKLPPVVRLSGDIAGTPGCRLKNGDRQVMLERGVIVAARHLHISPDEAAVYGLKTGDEVGLSVPGPRGTVFHKVIVRSGPGHVLEAHIDREEANACGLVDGQLCQIVKDQAPLPVAASAAPSAAFTPPSGKGRGLLTEDDVMAAHRAGHQRIILSNKTIVTPLARDQARARGIELVFDQAR